MFPIGAPAQLGRIGTVSGRHLLPGLHVPDLDLAPEVSEAGQRHQTSLRVVEDGVPVRRLELEHRVGPDVVERRLGRHEAVHKAELGAQRTPLERVHGALLAA